MRQIKKWESWRAQGIATNKTWWMVQNSSEARCRPPYGEIYDALVPVGESHANGYEGVINASPYGPAARFAAANAITVLFRQCVSARTTLNSLTFSPLASIVLKGIQMTNFYKMVIYLIAKENTAMARSVKESAKGMAEQPVALRLWLSCGAIGPLLFIIVFLIEGATRADYNPLRYPVSSLSIGDLGWMQAANFLMVGLLLFVFAIGLRRVLRGTRGGVWGPLLIGLSGIGLFGAGIFTTDPISAILPAHPLSSLNTLFMDIFTIFSRFCSLLVYQPLALCSVAALPH